MGVGGGVGAGGGLGNGGHGGLGAGAGANTGIDAGAKAGGAGASVNTHGNAGASATLSSTNPGDVLDHNTQLSGRLENMLGLSGPNALVMLKTDASSFKNFGQFMAAVHVSQNLDIPFAQLQAKMGRSPAEKCQRTHDLQTNFPFVAVGKSAEENPLVWFHPFLVLMRQFFEEVDGSHRDEPIRGPISAQLRL